MDEHSTKISENYCAVHNDVRALAQCKKCGSFLCPKCIVEVEGKKKCIHCYYKSLKPETYTDTGKQKQSATTGMQPLESHTHRKFQIQTFFHPVDKKKSDFRDLIVFEVEGEAISIERKDSGTIHISKSGAVISKIPKEDSRKVSDVEVSGHRIGVQYKEFPSLLAMLLWNSGFGIYVDGKPLEKTSSDPREALKYASYAFFLFAGISILTLLVSQTPEEKFISLTLLPILVLFGFLTKKTPIFTTALGSVFGVYEVFFYVIQSFETEYVRQTGWFLFWLLLRGGATLALIQGFIAGIKIRNLKRRTIRR